MKKSLIAAALVCAQAAVLAQQPTPTPSPNDVEALRQQVEALTETVKTLQQQLKDQQETLAKMNAGSTAMPANENAAPTPATGASAAPLFPTTDESVVATAPLPSPIPGAAGAAGAVGTPANAPFPTTDASVTTSSETLANAVGATLAAPMTIAGGGRTYMNLSFDGQFALAGSTDPNLDQLEVGDHDPQQRGFNARNLELALDGAVDPYFEGFANIVFKLDNNNETEVEVEEAFMQTTDLPWGLQLKGGQFFSAFGRINPTHPHTWDFVDDPIVHGRLLGSRRLARSWPADCRGRYLSPGIRSLFLE